MNLGFCTITSKSRLCQGIAMYNSLERNMSNFTLFILCTDKVAFNVLKNFNLAKARVYSLDDVENSELLRIKSGRTENEYCWTLKPVFLSYVMNNFPEIDMVTHVDADLYFFSDPFTVFHEGVNHSVLLTNHMHEVNDDINSGFVSFRRNAQGLLCLDWWKNKCMDWCFFRKEDAKFGDQGYLDKMLTKFPGILVIKTPGVNIAPWNSYRFTFEKRGSKIYANDNILIFYHFCGFRLLSSNEYGTIYTDENIPVIYNPYIEEVSRIKRQVESMAPGFCSRIGDDIQIDKILRRGIL